MIEPPPLLLLFLDLELDPREGTLKRDGQLVEVQPKVFEALVYFALRPERLVTKLELMQALWPNTAVEEASLTQVIFKMRRALGEPESPRVLHTVVKRGFRLGTPVTQVNRVSPPSVSNVSVSAQQSGAETAAAALPPPSVLEHPPRHAAASAPSDPDNAAPILAPHPEPSPAAPLPRPDDAGAPRPSATPQTGPPRVSATARAGRPSARILLLAIALVLAGVVALSAATTPTRTPLGGDLNTRKTTRLTRLPERDQEPSLAPDQSWFAFASTRDTGRYSIWVQRVDSGDPIQVTRPSRGEDTTPRVFPDGRAIAFTRCETTNPHAPGCSVWSVAPLGGDERLLVPDCNLGDLHPRKASVVCIRGSATGVAFVEASLSGSTVVHPTWHGPVESLRVSTDGALLFLSSEQPWLLASGRTEPRPLFAGAVVVHTLAFAPGGDHAIFDFSRNGRRTLWAAPLADLPLAPESLVPLTVGNGVDQYPDLSADGQLLLYAHETHKSALYLVDSEGRSPQQLDTPTSFLSISLGGLGQQVVAWDADGPTPEAEIVVFDLPPPMVPERDAPTEPARPPLTRGIGRGAFPALSPDEASVALVDRGALVLIELATRRRTTLVASEVREVRPAFTPDGRAIVFASGGKQPGLAQIRAERPAEGQAPLRLASGIFAAPTFTPDALHLLASGTPEGSESSGLYLIDLRSAKPSPPRLLSPYRSYEAAPLILPGHPGLAWVLVDERSAPRLEPVPLGLHLELPRPTDLAFPRDPANWGVFDIAARPEGGFVFLLKRVYSDIMSVRASP